MNDDYPHVEPNPEELEQSECYSHTVKNILLSAGMTPDRITEFTCFHCAALWGCEFAFDLYNLNGDCLAEK